MAMINSTHDLADRRLDPSGAPRALHLGLLVAAVVLVSLNLRAAVSAVPPLLEMIERDLGLHGATAGLLTALPVACMGLFAPLALRLANRFSLETVILGALGVLAVGLALRWTVTTPATMFLTTLLVSAGIAVGSALLPSIVKSYFPSREGQITGIYLMAMMLGATFAAASAVPLQRWVGSWQGALATWALPAVLGLFAWLPVLRRRRPKPPVAPGVTATGLPWRSVTAWLVTLFLSLTSLIFYSQLAWLAPAYRALGWSAEGAGLLLSLFTFAQVVAGLVVPWLADRTVERRPWFALVVGCVVIATAALLLWPETLPWVFVAVLGVGNAGAFSLGLLLLVDHSPDPATSGRLAAMAFLVSYGAAALGPPLLGGLRDATGSFTAGWLLLLVLSLAQLAVVSQFSPARRRRGV